MPETTPLRDRLAARTTVTPSGCWQWTGPLDRNGYGKIGYEGRTQQVHRLAYKALGPAFDHSLTLDHLCRNRACWRPEHLDPCDMRTNLARGDGWAGLNARVTHCPHGHEYTEANTRYRSRPHRNAIRERDCRQCARNRKRAARIGTRAAITVSDDAGGDGA